MVALRELQHLHYEDRLRELGVSQGERRLQGDPFQYLKEAYRKAGEGHVGTE